MYVYVCAHISMHTVSQWATLTWLLGDALAVCLVHCGVGVVPGGAALCVQFTGTA